MFDPKFSQAFQEERTLQGDGSTPQDPELLPLEFHHDTQHFAHSMYMHLWSFLRGLNSCYLESSPYPRLEIPQDLVGQLDAQGNSPATLHTWGVTHAITLDGTSDCRFGH